MENSENIRKVKEWDKLISSIKELESLESNIEKALKKTIESHADFRLKFLMKNEKKRTNPVNEIPEEVLEELRSHGVILTPKEPKEIGYSEIIDVIFKDEFVIEFLTYWFRRIKSSKQNLLDKATQL